jgi:hypothetical protein
MSETTTWNINQPTTFAVFTDRGWHFHEMKKVRVRRVSGKTECEYTFTGVDRSGIKVVYRRAPASKTVARIADGWGVVLDEIRPQDMLWFCDHGKCCGKAM